MSLPSFAEMGVPPPLQPQQGQFEQPQQHHDAATVTNTAKGINGVKHDAAKPVDNASPRPPSYNAYLETPRPKTRLQTVAAYRRCDFYNEWHSSDRIALFHCWPIEYWLNGRSRLARFLREGHRLGSPSYGLAPLPGDVILKTHRGARWTRNWGWCLSWKLATNPLYSNWYISVTAVSKTRPCFGKQKGICFSEANLDPGMQRWETTHTRGFRCRRIWAFTSREALPQVDRTWMAEVRLYLRDSSQLQNLDFRSLLTARNTAL
jgi:hypothetical protein